MSLISYKVIAALLIFIVSLATVIYPLKKRAAPQHAESFELGEALASGIFLGAAFLHMLPDSVRLFNMAYGAESYPVPEAVCVFSFLFLLFLERLSLASKASYSKNTIPLLLACILILHSVTEGAALGLGEKFTDALMIFIAILAHKGSESFALCMILFQHKLSYTTIRNTVILFAFMTPLGIATGTVIEALTYDRLGELVSSIFNAFAAGTFLYISTLHHVHFHKHDKDHRGLLEFGFLAIGAITMSLLALGG